MCVVAGTGSLDTGYLHTTHNTSVFTVADNSLHIYLHIYLHKIYLHVYLHIYLHIYLPPISPFQQCTLELDVIIWEEHEWQRRLPIV